MDEGLTVKAGQAASGFLADMGDDCNPMFQINTCLACPDGCGSSLTPSSAGPDHPGMGWFAVLCIIVFVVLLPLYVGIGFITRSRQGLSGLAALPPPLDKCAGASDSNTPDIYQKNLGGGYGTSDFDSI